MNTPTPELDKQSAVIKSGASDTLTEFFDWLAENDYEIAEWRRYEEYRDMQLTPIHLRPEQLFADFFGIDLDKIESERRAILEELRNA